MACKSASGSRDTFEAKRLRKSSMIDEEGVPVGLIMIAILLAFLCYVVGGWVAPVLQKQGVLSQQQKTADNMHDNNADIVCN
jgi:cell division protein FtsB